MEIFNSFESLHISLFSTNWRQSIIAQSGPSSVAAPKKNLAGRRSTELSQGRSYTWGKAITNSACHPCVPHTLHTHTDKHTRPLCMDLEAQPSGLQPPCTFSHYFIPPLPAPPLPVCMSFSVTRLCAKLHRGELPQYWGIVSYTGNFLPRCQAYFTLICLQRLLIKQPCLYTYLYRSPAHATLHAALDSMLLNIYLHWMSTEEE